MNTLTFTRHRDIQSWVARHRGSPAIRHIPNHLGRSEARLVLTFAPPRTPLQSGMPQVDDGLSPVSWTAWLAELDRRQLALRVSDRPDPDYELVERRDLH